MTFKALWRMEVPAASVLMKASTGSPLLIEKSFGRSPTLLLAQEEDNLIAFAHRGGPLRLAWSELKARARAANALFGLPLEECLPALRRHNPNTTRFLTL